MNRRFRVSMEAKDLFCLLKNIVFIDSMFLVNFFGIADWNVNVKNTFAVIRKMYFDIFH